jgi:hypothetical protein
LTGGQDIRLLTFGDNERMAFGQWVDVKKSEAADPVDE